MFNIITFPYRVLRQDVQALEHKPESQYKFNRCFAVIWFGFICAIPFIPKLYGHDIGVLIIQEISFWANFATHFGAMSSALAAINTNKTVQTIAEDVTDVNKDVADVADDVDDIHDVAQMFAATGH